MSTVNQTGVSRIQVTTVRTQVLRAIFASYVPTALDGSNGVRWVLDSLPNTSLYPSGFGAICYYNGVWVIVGYTEINPYPAPGRTSVWVNTGSGWVQTLLNGTGFGDFTPGSAFWDGSQFVVNFSTALYTSPDGLTWTQRTGPATNYLAALVYDPVSRNYIGLDYNNTNEYISQDLINWTSLTGPGKGPFATYHWVAVNDAGLIVDAHQEGTLGTGYYQGVDLVLKYSTNGGATWTPATISGFANNHNTTGTDVKWINNQFVMPGQHNGAFGYFTSSDGIIWTWTQFTTQPSVTASYTATKVIHDNDLYCFVSEAGTWIGSALSADLVYANQNWQANGYGQCQGVAAESYIGISRIQNILSQYQTGNSSIQNTTSQNQAGDGRIQITASYSQTGISKIRVPGLEIIIGSARIKVIDIIHGKGYRITTADCTIGGPTAAPDGFLLLNQTNNKCFMAMGGVWVNGGTFPPELLAAWYLS